MTSDAPPIITPARWHDVFVEHLQTPRPRRGGAVRLLGLIAHDLAVVGDGPIDEDACEHRNQYGPAHDFAPRWSDVKRWTQVKTDRSVRSYLAEIVGGGWLEQLEPPSSSSPGRYRLAVPAAVLELYPWSTPPTASCERCRSPWPDHHRPRCYDQEDQ